MSRHAIYPAARASGSQLHYIVAFGSWIRLGQPHFGIRRFSPTSGFPRPAFRNEPSGNYHNELPPDRSLAESSEFHRYPFYSPRFWHGMRPGGWFSLLKLGRFRVHPSRWGLLISISIATIVNTLLAGIQWILFGRKLAAGNLHGPPVFIVGHWRSGTTMLHELMVRDERYSCPSTYQCFAPHHFLVSQWFFRRFATWLLPGKRPMDNMAAGWDRPQEDEFAIMNLGMPSPYRRIAFPNEGAVDMNYLDLQSLDEADRQRWRKTLRRFFTAVSVSTGRPLIIKSPTHTGRIADLADEFPDARFVHITRDPRALYPSTCRLWQSLDEVQAMQVPDQANLPTYVVDCFSRMYHAFHRDRDKIPSRRLIDISYEQLTQDPVGTLQLIYDKLHLADFESVRPEIESWAETEHRGYQPNQHRLSDAEAASIKTAWQDYFQRYGYDDEA